MDKDFLKYNREFWVAYEDFDEKSKWRNSVYLSQEDFKIIDDMFMRSAERLRDQSIIFCKKYREELDQVGEKSVQFGEIREI